MNAKVSKEDQAFMDSLDGYSEEDQAFMDSLDDPEKVSKEDQAFMDSLDSPEEQKNRKKVNRLIKKSQAEKKGRESKKKAAVKKFGRKSLLDEKESPAVAAIRKVDPSLDKEIGDADSEAKIAYERLSDVDNDTFSIMKQIKDEQVYGANSIYEGPAPKALGENSTPDSERPQVDDSDILSLPEDEFRILKEEAQAKVGANTQREDELSQFDEDNSLSGKAKLGAASVATGVTSISESIWRAPQSLNRMAGAAGNYLEKAGKKIGLPDWMFSTMDEAFGVDPLRGLAEQTNKVADSLADYRKSAPKKYKQFKRLDRIGKKADAAMKAALKGDYSKLEKVLKNPNAWISFIGQAAPSLAIAYASGGNIAVLAGLEGLEFANDAADHEKKTGQNISDEDFTAGMMVVGSVNGLLEKFGVSGFLSGKGSPLAQIFKGTFREGGTEGLQNTNSNLAIQKSYDEKKELTSGLVGAVMGGAGTGGGLGFTSGVSSQEDTSKPVTELDGDLYLGGRVSGAESLDPYAPIDIVSGQGDAQKSALQQATEGSATQKEETVSRETNELFPQQEQEVIEEEAPAPVDQAAEESFDPETGEVFAAEERTSEVDRFDESSDAFDLIEKTPAPVETDEATQENIQEYESIDQQAQEAATSKENDLPQPTEGQIKAGTYKKGHINTGGLKISIENPKGSIRKSKNKDNDWQVTMKDHYGDIKGTVGKDGDNVDVFLGKYAEDTLLDVYVIDQVSPETGKFDEHKVMLGYKTQESATKAYNRNYEKDWTGLGDITTMSLEDFKKWVYDGKKTKPVSSSVNPSIESRPLDPGMSKSDLDGYVSPIKSAWKNNFGDHSINVVQSESDLPASIRGKVKPEGDSVIEGIFDPSTKTVYLVADNVPNVTVANKVIAHEVIGHAGLESMPGFQSLLSNISQLKRSGSKMVRDALTQVRERHDELPAIEEAKEILAILAETRPQNTLVQKAIRGLKTFLRKIGLHKKFSESDLRKILIDAAKKSGISDVVHQDPLQFSKRMRDLYGGVNQSFIDGLDKAPGWWKKTKNKIDIFTPAFLATLTRWHLQDVGGKYLPAIKDYVRLAIGLDGRRNELVNEAATLANKLYEYGKLNEGEIKDLADVMNQATINSFDPSLSGSKYKARYNLNELNIKISSLKRKILAAKTNVKGDKDLQELIEQRDFEKNRAKNSVVIKKQYDKLSKKARDLYDDVKEFYSARFEQVQNAMKQRINRAEISSSEKKIAIRKMEEAFKKARVSAPYFPLARQGEYFVVAKKIVNGKRETIVKKVDGVEDAKHAVSEFKKEGYKAKFDKKPENAKYTNSVTAGFMTDVIKVIDKAGVADGVKDTLYQLYLSTLPSVSMSKNAMHRNRIKGYSGDLIRSFSHNAFHGAYQLARLEYSDRLDNSLLEMEKEAKKSQVPFAKRLYDEMVKRHEWMLNPKTANWANNLTLGGFLYMLGLSPAAAIINLTQTALVSAPIMASIHGYKRVTKELARATADFKNGNWHIEKSERIKREFNGDTVSAVEKAIAAGTLDKTLAHDLAGLSETESAVYNPIKNKFIMFNSAMFHTAERFNRETTFVTAYRLARQKNKSHSEAYEYATKVIFDTHFDYSNANKPRFMQNDGAKVILLFKQYAVNMIFMLNRLMQIATSDVRRGALNSARNILGKENADFIGDFSAEEKKQAKSQFTGVLAMHFLAGGAKALPMLWLVMYMADLMLGDDDDPFDSETSIRNLVSNIFGDTVSKAISDGPVNTFLGVGLSNRVSLSNLAFRDANKPMDYEDKIGHIGKEFFGPLGGIVVNGARGVDKIAEGKPWRGVETMMPQGLKAPMKAIRYGSEGVKNHKGDNIVEDGNFLNTIRRVATQALGFTPAEISHQYNINRKKKNIETIIKKRRRSLLDKHALAWEQDDDKYLDEIEKEIDRFNDKNWDVRIKGKTLRKSRKGKRRRSRDTEGGIFIQKKLRDRVDEKVRFK